MKQIKEAFLQFIEFDEDSMNEFVSRYSKKVFSKKEIIQKQGVVNDSVYFINKGLIRAFTTDLDGAEHTCFFAMENKFVSDYTSFLTNKPGSYSLQALEDTEVVVMSKDEITESYGTSLEANMIGRKIAEHYFIFFDTRIQDMLLKTPLERYNDLAEALPNIHQRVPQHMLASYLNISAVHLSRIKGI